jgi:hypothetical protein
MLYLVSALASNDSRSWFSTSSSCNPNRIHTQIHITTTHMHRQEQFVHIRDGRTSPCLGPRRGPQKMTTLLLYFHTLFSTALSKLEFKHVAQCNSSSIRH